MRVILFILISALSCCAFAQRKITPVKSDDKKPVQPQLLYFDKHGNALETPVRFLTELDTVTGVKSGPVYPLLHCINVGANFFDGILQIAGQKHSSYDIWAELSLFNWIFPVVETGVGFASSTPENGNFTYRGNPSFYVKAGVNYNFLYKSNPDYQAFVGLRAGFSSFSYDITDITINSGYWDQTDKFNLPRQHARAFYGELLAGLKVKIAGPVSLGWTVRYHTKFGSPKGQQSTPWFIPGYGTTSPISASFSVICTIPLHKSKKKGQAPDDVEVDSGQKKTGSAEEAGES